MPNLVPTNIAIPAHLANRIGASPLAKALAGGIGGGADFPRISIKGSRFRIQEGGSETVLDQVVLDVIIVGANPRLSKTFYAAAWNPDSEPAAPDCYSLDGVAPAGDAVNPQNDLCATCPQNVWGSKRTPTGQEIKACADQKRLAVVAADDPSGPVYLLQVTPAALKGLNAYQKELSMRGISPEIVRTRVSFDTDASFPKLKFGFGGFIDENALTAITPLFGSPQVLEVTGEAPVDTAPPAPPAKPAAVRAAPAPQPTPEPAPEPAPEPRRGFGAKKAAPVAAPAAAAPAAPEPARRGFGTKKAPAAPVAAVTPAPAAPATPAVAAPAVAGGGSLVDEISALLNEVADDA